jgi:hypothetical protein
MTTTTTTERTRPRTAVFSRFEGRFTEIVPIGPVPDGVRMNGHFAGPITAGELAGGHLTGIDYFRIRSDGVGVVEAEEVVVLDGQTVAVTVNGYVLPPGGQPGPTLEQLSDPGFRWPDMPMAIAAFATFETAAPALAHLNRTIVAHTGWVNMGTGVLFVEARRLSDL